MLYVCLKWEKFSTMKLVCSVGHRLGTNSLREEAWADSTPRAAAIGTCKTNLFFALLLSDGAVRSCKDARVSSRETLRHSLVVLLPVNLTSSMGMRKYFWPLKHRADRLSSVLRNHLYLSFGVFHNQIASGKAYPYTKCMHILKYLCTVCTARLW